MVSEGWLITGGGYVQLEKETGFLLKEIFDSTTIFAVQSSFQSNVTFLIFIMTTSCLYALAISDVCWTMMPRFSISLAFVEKRAIDWISGWVTGFWAPEPWSTGSARNGPDSSLSGCSLIHVHLWHGSRSATENFCPPGGGSIQGFRLECLGKNGQNFWPFFIENFIVLKSKNPRTRQWIQLLSL